MIDDTRDNAAVLNDDPQTFLAEIVDLFQLRSDRNYAYNWSRNLKLLTLDDTEHSDPIASVQHNTRCAQCVASGEEIDPTKPINDKTQVWMCNACRQGPYFLGGRYHCSACDGGDYDLCARCVSQGVHCEDSTHKLLYSPLVCQHMAAHSCSSCMYMPLFPEKATVKEFRIVKQSDLLKAKTQCTHFVAVSYCWPHDESTADPQYRVRDENGNIRPNRAPNSVLDRAVAFARENGLRFIWIDQECINQDDSDEKIMAIQSMDLVYIKADISIGLLESPPLSKDQLAALGFLNKWGQYRVRGEEYPPSLDDKIWALADEIFNLMDVISREQWNTRAWILQESFSAGPNMVLLLNDTKGVHTELASLGAGFPFASHTALNMDFLNSCIFLTQQFFTLYSKGIFDEHEVAVEFMRKTGTQLFTVLDQLQLQFIRNPPDDPMDPERSEIGFEHPDGLGNSKIGWSRLGAMKRSCNAAMALTYLRYRDNTVISDRLSIFANLCNYEYRLNTQAVEQTGYPLSSAIMALSLLNGDYSLLLPEVYRGLDPAVNGSTRSRMLGPRSQLPKVYYFAQNPPIMCAPPVVHYYGCSRNGLSFPGFLWRIDQKLDVSSLQTSYSEKWYTCTFVSTLGRLSEDADLDAFLEPWNKTFDGLPQETRESLKPFKENMKNLCARPRNSLPIGMSENLLYGLHYDVVTDLLCLLRDEREYGIADAIWNSVQNDSWAVDDRFKKNDDVPFSVRDFPDGGDKSWARDDSTGNLCMSFNRDPTGKIMQSWLVNRIMRDGCLWYGGLDLGSVKEGAREKNTNGEENEQESRGEAPSQSANQQGEETQNEDAEVNLPPGRLTQQRVTSILTLKAFETMRAAGAKPERHISTDDPGSYVLLGYLASRDEAKHHQMELERRAVFDVDGPSLVVTPYNTNMELLPRSETRAMSASWIVEQAELSGQHPIDDETMHSIKQTLEAKQPVRGMWAAGGHPTVRYRLV